MGSLAHWAFRPLGVRSPCAPGTGGQMCLGLSWLTCKVKEIMKPISGHWEHRVVGMAQVEAQRWELLCLVQGSGELEMPW